MFDSIPNFTDGPSQGALADRGFQTGEPVEIKVDFKLTWFELKRQQILKALCRADEGLALSWPVTYLSPTRPEVTTGSGRLSLHHLSIDGRLARLHYHPKNPDHLGRTTFLDPP